MKYEICDRCGEACSINPLHFVTETDEGMKYLCPECRDLWEKCDRIGDLTEFYE